MPTATPGTSATITIPTPSAPPTGQRHSNLLNRLADALRSRHYSRRPEQAYLLEAGSDIPSIQKFLGRTNVSTTMLSTPVLTEGGHGVRRPGNALCAGIGSLHIPGCR